MDKEEEKMKKCEFCEEALQGNEYLETTMRDECELEDILEGGEFQDFIVVTRYLYDRRGRAWESREIAFCPFCGRKL